MEGPAWCTRWPWSCADEGAERSFERLCALGLNSGALPHSLSRSGTRAAGAIRPVVCGFGPAGLFAALLLAQAGRCRPIVLERGPAMEQRARGGGAPLNAAGAAGAKTPTSSSARAARARFRTASSPRASTTRLCAFVTRTLLAHGAPPRCCLASRSRTSAPMRCADVIRCLSGVRSSALGGEGALSTRRSPGLARAGRPPCGGAHAGRASCPVRRAGARAGALGAGHL